MKGLARSFVFALIIAVTSCIQVLKLPNYGDSDIYEKNHVLLNQSGTKTFIEVTAEDLLAQHATEIYLFSNWCPICYYHLTKELTPSNKDNVKYVSANYDIPFMEKHFTALDTIYILSNKIYGSTESIKIMKFASELTSNETLVAGVPQRFVWDETNQKFTRMTIK